MSTKMHDRIHEKLMAGLAPQILDIKDVSDRHIGHAGHDGQGESHFRVRVVSGVFEGLSRVDRQRRVLDLLAEELSGRLHALSIKALTPEEAQKD